jgi:hypothetical protein
LGFEKIAGFASSYRIAYDDERRVYAKVGAGEACDLLILIVPLRERGLGEKRFSA